ncbi:MAG: SDR family oxidoreductase [Deltaproteobacteria bacterium]|nr:SDR family oxidoreductase [Deltaproteobacteria bacterium]
MSISGKVVAITGAASGIGLAASKLFAKSGATVLMSDLDAAALEAAAAEIRKDAPTAQSFPADVTKPADVEALVQEARKAHGRLDVMVNNAGVLVTGPFDAMTEETLARHIEVNLLGVMYGTLAAARLMRAQPGGGHIVNIASLAGLSAVPGAAAYCASKFGVRGWTLSCAQELRDTPVRLTVICPDAVETPMVERAAAEAGSPIIFSGTTLTVDRVARAIVQAVEKPRREVCIPAHRGFLAKMGSLFPDTGDWLLALFERTGRANIARRGRTGG